MTVAGVELREIEAVLVLAEELHFGRTAERLLVSTGRVSQLVQVFERRIGGPVFERTSRRVGLTPLGESVVRGLRPVVAELDRTLRDARDRAAGAVAALRIGHAVTATDVPELDQLIAAYHGRHPNRPAVRLRFDSLTYFASVLRGELDLWITWWPGPFPAGAEVCSGPPIAQRDPVLLVGSRHPLAGRDSIGLDDLTVHPVLAMPSTQPALFRKGWRPGAAPSGRPIATVEGTWTVGTFQELAWVLERGELGWFSAGSLATQMGMPRTVVAVPVRDAAPFALLPLWRPAAECAAIRDVVGMIGTTPGVTSGGRARGPVS